MQKTFGSDTEAVVLKLKAALLAGAKREARKAEIYSNAQPRRYAKQAPVCFNPFPFQAPLSVRIEGSMRRDSPSP